MVETQRKATPLMSAAIQITMPFARLIVLLCRPQVDQNYQRYGGFGQALAHCLRLRPASMSETFVNGHIALIRAEVQTYCNSIPAYRHYDAFRVRYGRSRVRQRR